MQFQVPQFIEVEDKIFGPLTFKQFIYMGGGLGMAYIAWRLLPFIIAAPLMLAAIGAAAALAFFKYNGRPFIMSVESAFYYFINAKLYLWNNEKKTRKALDGKHVTAQGVEAYAPRLADGKLHELAWSLDVQERIAAGTITNQERVQHAQVLPVRTARDDINIR